MAPSPFQRHDPDSHIPAGARDEVDALNRRTWEVRTLDLAEGLRLAQQAREAARAAGYARGEAYALRNAGSCRCLMRQLDAALSDLYQAERLFGALGDEVGTASVLNWIGNVHLRRAECPTALQLQLQALEMQRRVGDVEGEGSTHIHLGNVYYELSDFPRALEHFRAALALKEAQRDSLGRANAMNNIGNIYGRLHQYDTALDYHTRTLALRRGLGDRLGESIALVNVGSSYKEMGEYPRALELFQAALEHAEQMGNLEIRAEVLVCLGDVTRQLGKLEDAVAFYTEAIHVASDTGNTATEAGARVGLGQALVAAGAPHAADELRTALVLGKRIQSPLIVYEAHQALSDAYEAGGDLGAALEHYRAYHRVKDEVEGAETERRIQAILTRAEIERGQREAELLRAQAAELERLTREDALTGLANRRHLDALLALEWERARRFGRHLTAVMVDVDHFKAVNDGWSHATGDAVLRQVAHILRDGIRAVDVAARYGGEEFVLLLVETEPGQAVHACEKLRAAIEAHDWPSIAPGLRVTASFGVAGNTGADSPDDLLAAADARLYTAKRAGRNRVVAA
ncbi:MAG TPA: tetratricopeptide repeat-containing diguanylate cyclase [Longimicrobium sp.]|nr:tetratricopeptide repeat-containing diguanylate cyclase [Longimicrobium sp.]